MGQSPNWFASTAQKNFESYLSHLAGRPNLRFLQIGVFAGHASEWLLQKVLTDPSSKLVDIDTWEGSPENVGMDFVSVYDEYKERVTTKYSNVEAVQADSAQYVPTLKEADYDFIYIDGNHTAAYVSLDAENAWPLLKPGGIMAFDDYQWDIMADRPKPAIDKFLADHGHELTVLLHAYQVWVHKR